MCIFMDHGRYLYAVFADSQWKMAIRTLFICMLNKVSYVIVKAGKPINTFKRAKFESNRFIELARPVGRDQLVIRSRAWPPLCRV